MKQVFLCLILAFCLVGCKKEYDCEEVFEETQEQEEDYSQHQPEDPSTFSLVGKRYKTIDKDNYAIVMIFTEDSIHAYATKQLDGTYETGHADEWYTYWLWYPDIYVRYSPIDNWLDTLTIKDTLHISTKKGTIYTNF